MADRRCRLEVRRDGDTVRVRLFDRSRRVPAVLVPGWESESGRGLWLLREMTAALGYTCVPEGKWVWFTVPLTTPGAGG
ncbi:ATP-binding protein [Streptomyces sp. ST2-7A]|uniref:ATP-binding protein n=1 Tax=Streptomyces sp. ST2-7A TaxID=2907214 RepID=UPI0035AC1F9C